MRAYAAVHGLFLIHTPSLGRKLDFGNKKGTTRDASKEIFTPKKLLKQG